MKKLLKPFIALVIIIGMSNNPTMSQTMADNRATTSNDMNMDRNDDTGKWGLLGLVGLIGLFGLKKRDRTDTYTSSTTPNIR